MPFSDELILQQLNELNATLKRIENLLSNQSQQSVPTAKTSGLKEYPYVFCDEKTASELTGLSRHWFARMRWAGGGPPYTKIGTSKGAGVRYKVADLTEWFENNKVRNTSQIPVQPKRSKRTELTF